MKVINGDYDFLRDYLKGKPLIIYGTGRMLYEMEIELPGLLDDNAHFHLVDSDYIKWGQTITIYGFEKEVEEPNKLILKAEPGTIILITSSAFEEIIERLRSLCIDKDITLLWFSLLRLKDRDERKIYVDDNPLDIPSCLECIPKKIHYFWVGNKKFPDHLKRNIESWHKYCSEYEIILWNEDKIDINECSYARQAYESGKFGFVPDYFRLKVIYEEGGIYLDTDVELKKPIDDLRYFKGFAGFEDSDHVAFGLGFGAVKGLPVIKEMFKDYYNRDFIREDGSLNLTSSPHYQTEILKKYGLVTNGRRQNIAGMEILPMNYLCGQSWRTGLDYINQNTFSVHHYEAAWLSHKERGLKRKEMEWIKRLEEEKCIEINP